MTATRTRKEEMLYHKWRKTADQTVCVFCEVKKTDKRFVEETPHFFVIKNDFPYSLWDHQGVESHLMITPKMHTSNLSNLTNQQKIEYFDLIEKYESKGYNIFARSPYSIVKTIPHQHTHLIKPTKGLMKFIFSINKPYIRIAK